MSSDIYEQQLSAEADTSEAAINAEVSDDTADSNTAADTEEWAEWDDANAVCMLHLNADSSAEHSIHDAVVCCWLTAQDSKKHLSAADWKASEWT